MYELDFYIPEDGNPQSHRRENLKSYTASLFHMFPLPNEQLRARANFILLLTVI
jgi:hypothetical protein